MNFEKVSQREEGLAESGGRIAHTIAAFSIVDDRTGRTATDGGIIGISAGSDPTAHAWTETSRTPATCLPGTINYTCSACNQTKTEPLSADPTAHAWTETSRTPENRYKQQNPEDK